MKVSLFFFILLHLNNLYGNSLDQALDLARNKKYDESKKILIKITNKNNKNALAYFNLGNIYYLINQNKKAVKAYKKVISLKSSLKSPAYLYLSKIYFKNRKYNLAAKYLNKLWEQELPPSFKEGVIKESQSQRSQLLTKALELYTKRRYIKTILLLRKIAPYSHDSSSMELMSLSYKHLGKYKKALEKMSKANELRGHKQSFETQTYIESLNEDIKATIFKFRTKLALGYDSNYYLEHHSTSPETTSFLRTEMIYQHPIIENTSFESELNLNFFSEFYSSTELNTFYSYSASNPYKFMFSKINIKLTPIFKQQKIDSDSFAFKPAFQLDIEHQLSEINLSMSYLVSSTEIADTSLNYLNGTIQNLSFNIQYSKSKHFFGAKTFYRTDNIGNIESTGIRLPLSYYSIGEKFSWLWILNNKWNLLQNISVLNKSYSDLVLPENIKRTDNEIEYSLKLSHSHNSTLSSYVFASYLNNSSNTKDASIGDQSFNKYSILGGVQWDIKL